MKFLKRNWAVLVIIGTAAAWLGISLGTNNCPSCVVSEIAKNNISLGQGKRASAEEIVEPKMPAWNAVDTEGRKISTASLQGKVSVVVFWATWCGGCKREIPDLVALRDAFPTHDVEIIGLSVDEAHKDLQAFAQQAGINYRIARATDSANEAFGKIDSLPTIFIIDGEGRIKFRHAGNMAKDALVERIRSVQATSA